MTTSYRCWAEINIEAIRSNLGALRSMVASEVRVATFYIVNTNMDEVIQRATLRSIAVLCG